jgi:hypothetical protein
MFNSIHNKKGRSLARDDNDMLSFLSKQYVKDGLCLPNYLVVQ